MQSSQLAVIYIVSTLLSSLILLTSECSNLDIGIYGSTYIRSSRYENMWHRHCLQIRLLIYSYKKIIWSAIIRLIIWAMNSHAFVILRGNNKHPLQFSQSEVSPNCLMYFDQNISDVYRHALYMHTKMQRKLNTLDSIMME